MSIERDPAPWRSTETQGRFASPRVEGAPRGGWSWEPRPGYSLEPDDYQCVCGCLYGSGGCALRAHLRGPMYATTRGGAR